MNGGCGALAGELIIVAISWVITAGVVMLLWNWIVPSVFNGPMLTFWQTLAGCFLIGVTGKLLGFGGSSSSSSRR